MAISTASKEAKFKLKLLTDFSMHKEALTHLADGYLHPLRRPEFFIKGIFPTHLKSGLGCHVFDYKNKKYIDMLSAQGTNLLGYANETITSAVIEATRRGNLLSLGSEYEIQAAKKLKELIPFVDCLSFHTSVQEAILDAARFAKLKTGRSEILTSLDSNLATKDAAAILVTAEAYKLDNEGRKKLSHLREFCTKEKIFLVFIEALTALRVPGFSAARFLGIEPDLIILGGAIANGYPLAAIGGKYAALRDSLPLSEIDYRSIHINAMPSFVAAIKTIELLQKEFNLDELWRESHNFVDEFNHFWPEAIRLKNTGVDCYFEAKDDLLIALLMQEACFAGILTAPFLHFNFPLIKEASYILSTFRDILYRIKSGAVQLMGEMFKKD